MMLNILLAGVGGQGTVIASKLIAACAVKQGKDAHTAETIGMAQRGGSVVSHARIGSGCHSPLIPIGQADLLIAFEPAEALRNLHYLKENGCAVINSTPVKLVTDTLSKSSYSSEDVIAEIDSKIKNLTIIDGDEITKKLKSAKSLNIALIGAALTTGLLGFTKEELEEAISTTLKPRFKDQNIEALKLGIEAAEAHRIA